MQCSVLQNQMVWIMECKTLSGSFDEKRGLHVLGLGEHVEHSPFRELPPVTEESSEIPRGHHRVAGYIDKALHRLLPRDVLHRDIGSAPSRIKDRQRVAAGGEALR